jgi:hypothetical protein
MFTLIYIGFAVGAFRALYNELEDEASLVEMFAAVIVAVFWPVYWGYRITEGFGD